MIYEVKGLKYKYPGSDRFVLNGADITLGRGEILCILGPNGAGKTTLLNCLAGLNNIGGGSIMLDGRNIEKMSPKDIAQIIGYVPQLHTPAFNYSVKDFVLMGRSARIGMFGRPGASDEAVVMGVLEKMNLQKLADKSYQEISGGERQQVLIARALAQEPKAILFDEPTAHLDYGNQHRVLKLIREMADEGYSVIITTHNPEHALLLGDKAAIVSRDGTIMQGEVKEIVTEENLKKVYNLDIDLVWLEKVNRQVCVVPSL